MPSMKTSATAGTITMGIMSPVVPDMLMLPSRRRFQSRMAPGQIAPVEDPGLIPREHGGKLPEWPSVTFSTRCGRAPRHDLAGGSMAAKVTIHSLRGQRGEALLKDRLVGTWGLVSLET